MISRGKSKHDEGLTNPSENIVRHKQKCLITVRGAALRDWINKPTVDKTTGLELPGYGIINPPKGAEKDIIKYPKYRTICYEIKSGGKVGEQIH